MRGGEQESLSYKEESYKLDVNVDGNLNTTTMFTYDEDHNFSGFWFYKDNDNNSYVVNEKGEIISSNSGSFNLESGTFVRRVNLNEGEIGKTQNDKNDERIIYIAEKATLNDNTKILYNKNTLEIIKCSNKNYVGNYYVEFNKSRTETETETIIETIQLVIDSGLKNIIYPVLDQDNPEYNVAIDNTVDGTIGINFNIINNNNLIYAYRSRDIKNEEFVHKYDSGDIMANDVLLAIHLVTGVKKIGDSAFHSCDGLTQVTIPDSVTSIGIGAFVGCTGLTQVTIPDSVTSIGIGAFDSCLKLEKVTILGNIEIINSSTFKDCHKLTHMTIPSSVTTIGDDAFLYCRGLTQIEIPDSVISLGNSVFYDCELLTQVAINGALTTVGSSAFKTGSTLTIYCDDKNTITLITNDANNNNYTVSFYPLNDYYTKINN